MTNLSSQASYIGAFVRKSVITSATATTSTKQWYFFPVFLALSGFFHLHNRKGFACVNIHMSGIYHCHPNAHDDLMLFGTQFHRTLIAKS
jgi:hypothetical protein